MTARRRRENALILIAMLGACSPREPKHAAPKPIEVLPTTAAQDAPAPPPKGSCQTFSLRNIVGQADSPAIREQARRSSSARDVAVVEPAQRAPAPPRGDRLLLTLNANGTIIDALCG